MSTVLESEHKHCAIDDEAGLRSREWYAAKTRPPGVSLAPVPPPSTGHGRRATTRPNRFYEKTEALERVHRDPLEVSSRAQLPQSPWAIGVCLLVSKQKPTTSDF
jgi:hypothetical protein